MQRVGRSSASPLFESFVSVTPRTLHIKNNMFEAAPRISEFWLTRPLSSSDSCYPLTDSDIEMAYPPQLTSVPEDEVADFEGPNLGMSFYSDNTQARPSRRPPVTPNPLETKPIKCTLLHHPVLHRNPIS